MKTKLLILLVLVIASFAVTSCASSKPGCKATHGFIGYR